MLKCFNVGPAWKTSINLFKPEFTFVIFIHYEPRIAVAILDWYIVDEDELKWFEN